MTQSFDAIPRQSWTHPCVRCGACCSRYRVSFYWAEADDGTPGGVPVSLTEVVTPHLRAMRGTNQPLPRCIALDGTIGEHVHCTVYPQRPSPCRDFLPSFERGATNPRCDAARAAWGLSPLSPADWAGADLPDLVTIKEVIAASPAVAAEVVDPSLTPDAAAR